VANLFDLAPRTMLRNIVIALLLTVSAAERLPSFKFNLNQHKIGSSPSREVSFIFLFFILFAMWANPISNQCNCNCLYMCVRLFYT
jgi:hypothetical protein